MTAVILAASLGAEPAAMANVGDPPDVPVIFVHGLRGSADGTWGEWATNLVAAGWKCGAGAVAAPYACADPPLSVFSVDLFLPSGDFYVVNLSSSTGLTLEQQGYELAVLIQYVRRANNDAPGVVLVGHSMGGLAARAYLQGYTDRPYTGDVTKLITVDTPHLGSSFATACIDVFGLAAPCLAFGWPGVGIVELALDSPSLESLNFYPEVYPVPVETTYVSFIGVGFEQIGPDTSDGDGIVASFFQNLASVPAAPLGLSHSIKSFYTQPREGCDVLWNFPGFRGDQSHTCVTHDDAVFSALIGELQPSLVILAGLPSTIIPGQSAKLSWSSTNASHCVASGGWQGPRPEHGQELVSPATTTTYTLTCSGVAGATSDTVTITLAEPLPAPSLGAPLDQATGVTTTPALSWSAVAGADLGYRVLVGTSTAGLPRDPTVGTGSGLVVNATSTGTSYPVPAGHLTPNTKYYWEVHGRSSTTYGLWSEIRGFTTGAGPCAYSVNPISAGYDSSGGSGQIVVSGGVGCEWEARSLDSWLTITAGSSGSGVGVVAYELAQNTGTVLRSGSLTVAGTTVTITQAGLTCSYVLNPTQRSHTGNATAGGLDVSTSPGCLWAATEGTDWLSLAPAAGVGPGTVTYSLTKNDGDARQTTISIAGVPFDVWQGPKVPDSGVIRVTITPYEAAWPAPGIAGGQWRILGTTEWRNSGAEIGGAPIGTNIIEYKDIPYWIKPPNQDVILSIINPSIWIDSLPYGPAPPPPPPGDPQPVDWYRIPKSNLPGEPVVADTWPPFSTDDAMVFDSGRNRLVLLTSTYRVGIEPHVTQTWEFDGILWERIASGPQPAPRFRGAMAYDETRATAVLFGGRSVNDFTTLGDTWVYDNGRWIQKAPAATPSPSENAVMAYSAELGAVVLLGAVPGEYWTWDGGNWTKKTDIFNCTLGSAAISYDPGRQRLLVYRQSSCTTYTFIHDGLVWTNPSISNPVACQDIRAGYSHDRQRVVMSGGDTCDDRTWEFDGNAWSRLVTAHTPGKRWTSPVAGAPDLGGVFLYGGVTDSGPSNDLWVLSKKPAVATSTDTLLFQAPPATESTAAFDVWNGGYGVLRYTLVDDANCQESDWLTVQGEYGLGSGAAFREADPITVRADTTGMTSGHCDATISIVPEDPAVPTRTVAVSLDVTSSPCGNGVLDRGEDCDDGDSKNGDCCSATCQLESLATPCVPDSNPCTDDICDGAGACAHLANTASCNDGNACTLSDRCQLGTCAGYDIRECTAIDDCHGPGSCQSATGVCSTPVRDDGSSCDDGLFCTATDSCSAGTCVGTGNPCAAGSECNNSCSEANDNCAVGAGTACSSDSNPCTLDQCNGSGTCVHPAGNGGTVCRAANSTCDAQETCTGTSTTCPANSFATTATVCRGSTSICDEAESCSGSAATCPSDGFAPSSTTCRGSAGVCDVAENCTGTGASCPADGFLATTVCRASGGICDAAESCTGTGATCPGDAYSASTTVCRTSAGVCDAQETCTGTGASCPADAFSASTTVCRAASGVCDPAENCTGTSGTCPANGFLGTTTVCRNSAGVCDAEERCSGGSESCPTNAFASSSTVCRATAGVCDTAENCTGSTASCPANALAGTATTCRAASGTCDVTESCNGSAAGCPANAFATTATSCRPSAGVCDVQETCNGTTGNCPADVLATNNTPCTSDGNACTNDVCNGAGTCTHPNNSLSCDDGDACTLGDQCSGGACHGQRDPECKCGDGVVDDGEDCDDGDTLFLPGQYCGSDCVRVPCGKPTDSAGDKPTTADALFALKASVKLAVCDMRLCDVNNDEKLLTYDALKILQAAVSLPVTLECPDSAAASESAQPTDRGVPPSVAGSTSTTMSRSATSTTEPGSGVTRP